MFNEYNRVEYEILEQGMELGIEQGIKLAIIKMFKYGIEIEEIADILGISKKHTIYVIRANMRK